MAQNERRSEEDNEAGVTGLLALTWSRLEDAVGIGASSRIRPMAARLQEVRPEYQYAGIADLQELLKALDSLVPALRGFMVADSSSLIRVGDVITDDRRAEVIRLCDVLRQDAKDVIRYKIRIGNRPSVIFELSDRTRELIDTIKQLTTRALNKRTIGSNEEFKEFIRAGRSFSMSANELLVKLSRWPRQMPFVTEAPFMGQVIEKSRNLGPYGKVAVGATLAAAVVGGAVYFYFTSEDE